MRSTIADETRMYAWSPLSYHWFKFSVAVMLLAGCSRLGNGCIHDSVTSVRVYGWNVLESPPVVLVPLYGTGSPTQAYDMLKVSDRAA
jgi:hypothetical protein